MRAEKEALRRRIAQAVAVRSPEQRTARSAAILGRLLTLPAWRQARRVLLFASMRSEVSTEGIIDAALAAGKEVYLPKVVMKGRRLLVCRVRGREELAPGAMGILEPRPTETITPAELDFVLVPGRAFDRRGNRLGWGGGFYDNLLGLSGLRAEAVAVAFDCQIVEHVPHGLGDRPVRFIITEYETIGET